MLLTSVVWEFFEVGAVDESIAKCKLSKSLISRGGRVTSTYNTSNLMKHLHKTHSEQWTAAKRSHRNQHHRCRRQLVSSESRQHSMHRCRGPSMMRGHDVFTASSVK